MPRGTLPNEANVEIQTQPLTAEKKDKKMLKLI